MKLTNFEKLKLAGLGIATAILLWIVIYTIGNALMHYARYSGFMSACKMFHPVEECKTQWRNK